MPERVEPNPTVQGYVLLDLRMMVGTVGGRERTAEEFKALLSAANLQLARIIPTPAPVSVIEATPA
jgi:hypothetical protein